MSGLRSPLGTPGASLADKQSVHIDGSNRCERGPIVSPGASLADKQSVHIDGSHRCERGRIVSTDFPGRKCVAWERKSHKGIIMARNMQQK